MRLIIFAFICYFFLSLIRLHHSANAFSITHQNAQLFWLNFQYVEPHFRTIQMLYSFATISRQNKVKPNTMTNQNFNENVYSCNYKLYQFIFFLSRKKEMSIWLQAKCNFRHFGTDNKFCF